MQNSICFRLPGVFMKEHLVLYKDYQIFGREVRTESNLQEMESDDVVVCI